MAPERNVALELSDPILQKELADVLAGEIEVPTNNQDIEEILDQLKSVGIISREEQPLPRNLSSCKRNEVIWRIQKKLVGKNGPVIRVYWLDPAKSKFSSSKTNFFTAKYSERMGDKEGIREAWASGNDPDLEQAEFKAIMEALERHASGVIPREQLIRSTPHKLGDQILDPRKVVAYTKSQYKRGLPFVPFALSKEYWWKAISVLPEGKEKYLPVECLY